MRRGPSGKVVCCICKKWLLRTEAVGLGASEKDDVQIKPMHVDKCFAIGLSRIGAALNVGDPIEFAVRAAFKIGQATR